MAMTPGELLSWVIAGILAATVIIVVVVIVMIIATGAL